MKFNLSCRDIARLVLQGEDRTLAPGERLRLRFHLLVCKACPRFVRQMQIMRRAVGRWKQYADGGDGPPTG